MRIVVFTVVGLLSMCATARAQESRAAVSVVTGGGTTYDDEGSLGSGWLAGAAIERVIFGTTRLQGSLEYLSHHRDIEYFGSSGGTTVVGVSLVHRFGRQRAQPYVLAGVTLGHHSGTNRYGDQSIKITSTDGGFRFGAGVAVQAGKRFEIAPEFRFDGFQIDNDSAPAMLPSFAVRVAVRL